MTLAVVIPAFNAEAFVAAAIESVLLQGNHVAQVVVVDDGSTDGTASLAAKYPVRVIRQRNSGVAHARNAAIAATDARLFAFLDADDRWLPGKLERQLAMFENPRVGVVFGSYQCVDEHGAPIGQVVRASLPSLPELVTGNRLGMLTVVVRRELLQAAGGFYQAVAPCEDWDLWIRLRARCEFAAVSEPVAEYRLHANNASKAAHRMFRARMSVLDRASVAFGSDPACRQAVVDGRRLAVSQYFDSLRAERRSLRQAGHSGVAAALSTLPRDPRAWLSWPGYRKRHLNACSIE